MGQHTHRSSNTHFDQVRSDLFFQCSTHSRWMTHWTRWWCVSLKSFCNAQPPFHGLCIQLDTDPVQMYFFHAMAWRSNTVPENSVPHPEHLFCQRFFYVSVGEALLRWASSMLFVTSCLKCLFSNVLSPMSGLSCLTCLQCLNCLQCLAYIVYFVSNVVSLVYSVSNV